MCRRMNFVGDDQLALQLRNSRHDTVTSDDNQVYNRVHEELSLDEIERIHI